MPRSFIPPFARGRDCALAHKSPLAPDAPLAGQFPKKTPGKAFELFRDFLESGELESLEVTVRPLSESKFACRWSETLRISWRGTCRSSGRA